MTGFMTAFVILIGAHFVGDYALQTDYLATNKGKSLYVLTAHSAIWSFCITMTAWLMGFPPSMLAMLVILFIPHFVIDKMKVRKIYWFSDMSDKHCLILDQYLHMVQLLVYLAVTY